MGVVRTALIEIAIKEIVDKISDFCDIRVGMPP
jgi:hypothetical protein